MINRRNKKESPDDRLLERAKKTERINRRTPMINCWNKHKERKKTKGESHGK